ncbi:hypothetical protein [Flavobacterium sp. KBS0721]|uniref:hypothetical protein n=1 Tax=Flavobacterium sp. KBS0721 TaxID=1179672 RepID=UPI00098EA975|nr:hypothetical protein [Flavobacterium sp. KBS0721]QDW21666.1 hypothetical protein B0M43_0016620 [Flavobacterium sp. KBS0721]
MFDETKKSVESILSQRLTSPFYGTLIISWLIWNWKIIYLTIFVSEDNIKGTKIEYIVTNYNDPWLIVYFPLLSTGALLIFLPFVTNGAYWLDLIFNKWRVNKKNFVESKQLLTIEDSINLRELLLTSEKRFDTLLADKNAEIEQLKAIIENSKALNYNVPDIGDRTNKDEIQNLVKQITENDNLKKAFKIIEDHILGRRPDNDLRNEREITADILRFYVSNDIISSSNNFSYKWTTKGKSIYKIIANNEFA